MIITWVRSRNCGCLVTWFCYQLIAKPGNKTATVPWPDPLVVMHCTTAWFYIARHWVKLLPMGTTNSDISESALAQVLLPDSTKPLPELMMSHHIWGFAALPQSKLHRKYSKYCRLSLKITDVKLLQQSAKISELVEQKKKKKGKTNARDHWVNPPGTPELWGSRPASHTRLSPARQTLLQEWLLTLPGETKIYMVNT